MCKMAVTLWGFPGYSHGISLVFTRLSLWESLGNLEVFSWESLGIPYSVTAVLHILYDICHTCDNT